MGGESNYRNNIAQIFINFININKSRFSAIKYCPVTFLFYCSRGKKNNLYRVKRELRVNPKVEKDTKNICLLSKVFLAT